MQLGRAIATVEVPFQISSSTILATMPTITGTASALISNSVTSWLDIASLFAIITAGVMMNTRATGKVVCRAKTLISLPRGFLSPVLTATLIPMNLVITAHTTCVTATRATHKLDIVRFWFAKVILLWSNDPTYNFTIVTLGSTGDRMGGALCERAVGNAWINEISFEAHFSDRVTVLVIG